MARRGVVGRLGRVEGSAALFEAARAHHFGELRFDLVGRHGQRAGGGFLQALHPAIGGQVVFGVAHCQRCFAQRRAVAGHHAVHIGFGERVHGARVVGVTTRAEDLNAAGQR